ncbi:GTP cyclohydrolase I FolE [Vagococcus acidifermentans]|uniref:GTP cyclohydrolase 1 n=1 Tax=Vagococcus acidifermentans TaxID=564710 RepID=A0A430AVI5_9ENTE|nr:GTP cyclohydrolase I FolE [Vagococcus acidifermentans]RSU12063.1 GTP cyclohydrolase I FolE [Vagococcus acidifermentans]
MNSEQKKIIQESVKNILRAIGEDVTREGLIETPERVAKMYEEIFSSVTETDFNNCKVFTSLSDDDIVLVKDIPFYSMCEHHLLPFYGKAHVAYIPSNKQIIGLSKIPRMVDYCAKRPNVQENLTIQIARLLEEKVSPQGIAVAIEAEHMCMSMRGIKKPGSTTKTFHYSGCFKTDRDLKREFLEALT